MSNLEEALATNAALVEWVEKDKTGLYNGLTRIRKAIEAREWILDGRGPYEWDDDRYRQEASWAFEEVIKIISEVQRESDKRVTAVQSIALSESK